MRTRLRRFGAGVLLAGTTILGGCLTADKPKNPTTLPKTPIKTNSPTVNGGQPGASGQPGFGQPAWNQSGVNQPNPTNVGAAGQPTGVRNVNSPGPVNDPRVGMTGGPINNNTVLQPINNTTTPYGGVQNAGGVGNGPVNPDLKAIGSSRPGSAAYPPNDPRNPANDGASNFKPMPPLDPAPSKFNPDPVTMQGADRDLNRLGNSSFPPLEPPPPLRPVPSKGFQ